jgi:opacity protein-like surface antigen
LHAQPENQLKETNVKAHSYALLSLNAVTALALFVPSSSGEERPGPYFNAALGGSVAADTKLREFPNAPPGGKVKFTPGVALDVGGGFRFNEWLLVGGETGVLVNGIKGSDAALSQVPILANVELRFPNNSPLVPFIGGGPGIAFSTISLDNDNLNGGSNVDGSDSSAVFAWQAYGGIRYKINESMSLGVSYKYFWANKPQWEVDNSFQDIRFGESHIHVISANFSMSF